MWEITDHVCRVCFGRVLVGVGDNNKGLARCADCGVTGAVVKAICTCGIPMNTGGNGGLRCMKNPRITIENPAEIVVRWIR